MIDNRSDEELMRLFILTKEAALFSLIYQRYFVSLSKYLKWLLDDIELAKDIAQNIFIKIHNNPGLFDTTGNFKVWLFAVAKNQWKNVMRNKTSRKNSLKVFSNTQQVGQHEAISSNEASKKVLLKNGMNALSEKHKEVIALKYSNNLSINEIATVLHCSEGTVKSRLFHALNNLKDSIKKEGL